MARAVTAGVRAASRLPQALGSRRPGPAPDRVAGQRRRALHAGHRANLETAFETISALRRRPLVAYASDGFPLPVCLATEDADVIAYPPSRLEAQMPQILALISALLDTGEDPVDVLADLFAHG